METAPVAVAGRVPDRTQTGLRVERSLVKVLKGLAEYLDMSLAELVEGMLLHSLEGKPPFTEPTTVAAIAQLRTLYGLELTAADSHTALEGDAERSRPA